MIHGTRMQLDDHKRRKKAAARKVAARPRAKPRVKKTYVMLPQSPVAGVAMAAALVEGLRR